MESFSTVKTEERVKEILGHVGLDPDVSYRYPHEFSGTTPAHQHCALHGCEPGVHCV
jgi:ABC-type oligopeptide transport system ATPase subunit